MLREGARPEVMQNNPGSRRQRRDPTLAVHRGQNKGGRPSLLKGCLVTLGLGYSNSVRNRTSPQGSPLDQQKEHRNKDQHMYG